MATSTTTDVTQLNFLSPPVHNYQVTGGGGQEDRDECADSGARHSDWDINDVTFDLVGRQFFNN